MSYIKIEDNQGTTLEGSYKIQSQIENGVVPYSYRIPEDIVGGVFQVVINAFTVSKFTRTIRISQENQPEMYITSEFAQTSYSPGEQVQMDVMVRRPDGRKLPFGSSI